MKLYPSPQLLTYLRLLMPYFPSEALPGSQECINSIPKRRTYLLNLGKIFMSC